MNFRRTSHVLSAVVATLMTGALITGTVAATTPADTPLDTTGAAQKLAGLIAAHGENADLPECPIGDISTLIAQAPEALGVSTATSESRQKLFTQETSTSVVCSMADASGEVVAEVYIGEPYEADPQTALQAILEQDFDVAFDSPRPTRGGTSYAYCARGKTAQMTHSFCEVDWVGADIQYGVAAVSPSISGNLVIEWLNTIIDEINSRFIASAATPGSGPVGSVPDVLDTTAATANFTKLLDEARTAGDTGELRDGCPVGDLQTLLPDAPADLDTAALTGDLKSRFTQMTKSDTVLCALFDGQLPSIVWGVSEPVADLTAAANELAAGPLTFQPEQQVAGGTMLVYCEENATTKKQNYCQADWQNGELRYAMSVLGEKVTAEQAGQWLTATLDDLTTAVAGASLGS